MGLLDWLTDGSLGNMGGIGAGETGAPPPNNAPTPPPPMPPVQQTGSDGPSLSPPQPNPGAMARPVDPSTQPLGGQGGGPAAPDPTPAAGPPDPPLPQGTDPMTAGGSPPNGPGLPSPAAPPMPAPRPSGAAASPTPAALSSPPGPPTSLAPPAPGPSAPEASGGYHLGDQTALGRALGINPQSKTFNDTLGGIGAGLTAAGNSAGKSKFQALASGAGATLEGANKEAHASEKDANAYLAAAISAKKAGDDATYKTNYTSYLAAKLQLEQKQAADKDAAGNKNDSPTQLFLAAQRNVAADPLVKGSLTAYQAAIKEGDPAKIATAKSAYEQTVQERQSAHLAGVGLHPQAAADLAKQPGMTQANPLDASKAGITPQNITKKLQPGQFYTNPADVGTPKQGTVYQYKGSPTKSGDKSSAIGPTAPEPASPLKKVAANTDTGDDD